MTQRTARQVKDLCETTRKYSPKVQDKLSKAPDDKMKEAFGESAAKYYPALEKLAKE